MEMQTVREQLLNEYSSMTFRATTQPYKSRLPFTWLVADPLPSLAASTVAFAVLNQGQVRDYFSFAIGDSVPLTTTATKIATDADTNQADRRNTNGVQDFVIESISASSAGIRAEYTTAQVPAGIANPDVIAAFKGLRQICDPGTLIAPPQAWSPFSLEDAMYESLKSVAAVYFSWDRGGFIAIGTLDQIPEGGARSLLRASGTPQTENRYKVPEGYAWRRKSKADADFVTKIQIMDTVVCPINTVALAGQGSTATMPQALYQDIIVRVHGLGLTTLGQNAGA